jgi:dipeptidase D
MAALKGETMTFVQSLEPTSLWSHFDRILTIPRPSKQEEKIRRYVIEVAERHNLQHQVDGAGNVVVRKPGTSGREDSAGTILQAHLDMVAEKNSDVDHDFNTDPIQPQVDGEYLKASGTTLGSDNGIGVAAILAILEDADLQHGPLEFLFTMDEETGLTGASNLDASLLTAKRLINLDSEEEGALCVGCAGGADSALTLPLITAPTSGSERALTVSLSGLKGGHSGVDIHLQRGNAIKLLVRGLNRAHAAAPFQLAAIDGGNMHNAIPREASAALVVPENQLATIEESLREEFENIQREFLVPEPTIEWAVAPTRVPESAWDASTTKTLLRLVEALPHGVIAMSLDIPGLVETSTNFATLKEQDGAIKIGLSNRSSVASAMEALRQRIRSIGELAGATIKEGEGYPGWKPDMQSQLLRIVKDLHLRELGSEPRVEAIHAGLECGIIGKMIPGMDMISIGPQIDFPHSPDERVHIASVARFYTLLTRTLEELSSPS